jgi:hypothetical protein
MEMARPNVSTSAFTVSSEGSTTDLPTTPVSTERPPPSPRPERVRSG